MGTVYTQLSMQERRRIEDWWLAKVSVAEVARSEASQVDDFSRDQTQFMGG